MSHDRIAAAREEHHALLSAFVATHAEEIPEFVDALVEQLHQGGRLFLCGAGPYAAIADLGAQLFMHRRLIDRPLLPAMSLGHDAALATALAREGTYHQYFSRQLKALSLGADDTVLFFGAAGDNALDEGLAEAERSEALAALFWQGEAPFAGSPLTHFFSLNSASTPRGSEVAHFFVHLLCELVEAELFGF